MTTADEFCAALLSEVGYVETPDNITKFAAEAGHPNGYAWCMTFLVAIAKRTGLNVPYTGSNTLACADAFRAAGKLYQDPQRGDWTVFHGPDFPEGHIEGIIGVNPDGSLDEVGGNTTDGIHGSQWNGGMVARRHRLRAQIVGFCRPDYSTVTPPADVPATAEELLLMTIAASDDDARRTWVRAQCLEQWGVEPTVDEQNILVWSAATSGADVTLAHIADHAHAQALRAKRGW